MSFERSKSQSYTTNSNVVESISLIDSDDDANIGHSSMEIIPTRTFSESQISSHYVDHDIFLDTIPVVSAPSQKRQRNTSVSLPRQHDSPSHSELSIDDISMVDDMNPPKNTKGPAKKQKTSTKVTILKSDDLDTKGRKNRQKIVIDKDGTPPLSAQALRRKAAAEKAELKLQLKRETEFEKGKYIYEVRSFFLFSLCFLDPASIFYLRIISFLLFLIFCCSISPFCYFV